MDDKYIHVDMDMKMTRLSKAAFSNATQKMNSVEDSVRYLKEELVTRNVRSIILKFAKESDEKKLRKLLSTGLMANDAHRDREAEERRVRGWMNPGSVHSLKKEDAIEAAFILGLSLEEADEFVALISEEKLHWRNVEEIVYIYGLEHGLSYPQCRAILERPEVRRLMEEGSIPEEPAIREDAYTEFVQRDLEQIESEEELMAYLEENAARFGAFHNTAYDMFMEMMGKLENPYQMEEDLRIAADEEAIEHYTVRDILEMFFYQDIVLSARNKAVKAKKAARKAGLPLDHQYVLSLIQKKIAGSWPDEVSISKMKKRKMDVTRKALILLFLATDGDYDEFGYDYDLTEEEVFEDTMGRLNDMLFFCGYASLDPRNPFDWLIIYCIFVQDLLDIDPRLRSFLEELYKEE